jgi:hypothetical protein
MRATCHAHPNLRDFISIVIFSEVSNFVIGRLWLGLDYNILIDLRETRYEIVGWIQVG